MIQRCREAVTRRRDRPGTITGMNRFRIRTDLERARLGDFSLPLGLEPLELGRPDQGYVLDYVPAGSDDPGTATRASAGDAPEADAYRFHIVVSHERIRTLLRDLFALLGDEVDAVVEIGTRDAYRATDVYWSREPMPTARFLEVWTEYEPVLLEEGLIGAGATCEEPEIEIFVDEWKGITVHAPIGLRGEIERILHEHGLNERAELWPEYDERTLDRLVRVRPVLCMDDPYDPDIDEVLFQLRVEWDLELDIDPDANVDESGRDLGFTLWFASVLLGREDDELATAYLSLWATAGSLKELQFLVEKEMSRYPGWVPIDFYMVDRVAYDERPETLADLPPRHTSPLLHMSRIDRADEKEQPHGHGPELA